VAALAAAVVTAACATAQTGRGTAGCREVGGRLPAGASTADMRGAFRLTLVATTGAAAGRSVVGHLTLQPQDSALVQLERSTQPLRGGTDIDVEAVGAVRMGDLAAAGASAPGVAVYEQRNGGGAPTVVVRLGSASNARGAQPFDAAHTTLFVRRIGRDGFAGGWTSSAGSTFPPRRAAGYFCAVRQPAPS
jgi:hypothetical protein